MLLTSKYVKRIFGKSECCNTDFCIPTATVHYCHVFLFCYCYRFLLNHADINEHCLLYIMADKTLLKIIMVILLVTCFLNSAWRWNPLLLKWFLIHYVQHLIKWKNFMMLSKLEILIIYFYALIHLHIHTHEILVNQQF